MKGAVSRWKQRFTALVIPTLLFACAPTATDAAQRGLDVTYALHADRATGSAVYVGDGLFLTAAHVVGKETRFRLVRGTSEIAANLVSADFETDIALLRAEETPKGVVALTWAEETPTGTPVFAVGYPAPLDQTAPTVTNGIVSGLRSLDGVTYLQLDAPVNPGNSGGPVVTQTGHLAGIVVGRIRNSQGLNFAVPARFARDYVLRPVARGAPVATPTATPSPVPVSTFTAELKTINEVPAISGPEASCGGEATVTFSGATVTFLVTIWGCPSSTSISIGHIHKGPAGTNGAVVLNTGLVSGELILLNGGATFAKTVVADPIVIAVIRAEPTTYYLNIHSHQNGGGLIRGQLRQRT